MVEPAAELPPNGPGPRAPLEPFAAASLAPHDTTFYLRDLAGAFHSYYGAERFLVDDAELARARMALLAATAQVLRNALALLGVSAPTSMSRELPPLETQE